MPAWEIPALDSFARSQASAELLDKTGIPSRVSAIEIIEAHFNEVQDTKIASRSFDLFARLSIASSMDSGLIVPTTESLA